LGDRQRLRRGRELQESSGRRGSSPDECINGPATTHMVPRRFSAVRFAISPLCDRFAASTELT